MSERVRFRLALRMDGYYWLCPRCGYCQERAVCVDSLGEEWHMQAGEDGVYLLSSVLAWCRNCVARGARARRLAK